ncbi:MAG TPA: TolC family protein [Kofleriaceae bacterium]|jgi:outer membrane protein TolC|nr:TolC family protein [Kofleriaceae bacterium]
MLRLTLATVAITGACTVLRPVTVSPPRAPRAFATSFDAAEPPHAPAAPLTSSPVWWSAFADPILDAAIQEGFRDNNFIRDTRGLIYENMLDPATPQAWWWPLQFGILAPAGIQHIVVDVPPAPEAQYKFNLENVDLSATYQLDLWGNLDALHRAGMNLAEQQRQLTEGHIQDLAVQIAQAWFDILEARALRELTQTQIKYNQELYDLVKARFEQHLTPRLVVLQQEQLLLNLQSQLPLINARLGLINSQLHGYLGRMPTPADDIVPQDRQLPDVPPSPGIGTPGDLDANTPEMRLAKLRVAEVQHRINANLASWLPQVQLIGSMGVSTLGVSQPILREEDVGVTLTWVMFDGKRYTERKQLPMQLHRREIQYELALQTAVGRVQDAVIRENNQATSLQSLRAQVDLGRNVLDEARRLFEQGQSDYLPVLTALNNLVDLERAGLQAQRLLLNDRVELYRSLGGTWSYDVTTLRE